MTLDEDVKEIFRKYDENKRNTARKLSRQTNNYNPNDTYMGQPER